MNLITPSSPVPRSGIVVQRLVMCDFNRRIFIMIEKKDALELIELLSALESWSFSSKTTLPDYLLERLDLNIEKLRVVVLEP